MDSRAHEAPDRTTSQDRDHQPRVEAMEGVWRQAKQEQEGRLQEEQVEEVEELLEVKVDEESRQEEGRAREGQQAKQSGCRGEEDR